MRPSALLFRASTLLLPLSALALTYLYLYPFFHGCAFPAPDHTPPYSAASISSLSTRGAASGPQGRREASEDGDGGRQEGLFGPAGLVQMAVRARAALTGTTATTGSGTPFRLLALADPQLEGDSSLPRIDWGAGIVGGVFPSLGSVRDWRGWLAGKAKGRRAMWVWREFWERDVKRLLRWVYKSVDLWGNDWYLRHVYRSMDWWTQPTHVVVLGDLLGSQWVSDEEFERRSERFWNRVFKGTQRVPDGYLQTAGLRESSMPLVGGESWSKKVIAVVGNHDIGYAGDISEHRIARFERKFGKVNWSIKFTLPESQDLDELGPDGTRQRPTLRLVVLNDMNLDGPVYAQDLQQDTYEFLSDVVRTQPDFAINPHGAEKSATILLTHIPLHKPAGVCADAPYFSYFADEYGGGIREQNHLRNGTSYDLILKDLFGMSGNTNEPLRGLGRRGLILNGHDHVGCDVFHFWNRTASVATGDGQGEGYSGPHWDVKKWANARHFVERREKSLSNPATPDQDVMPGIREVTVRSMMGEFGGNAGLVSAWYDDELRQWRFEYASCALGVQHIWWAIHIFSLVSVLVLLAAFAAFFWEARSQRETVPGDGVRTKSSLLSAPQNDEHGDLLGRKSLQKQRSDRSLRGKRKKK